MKCADYSKIQLEQLYAQVIRPMLLVSSKKRWKSRYRTSQILNGVVEGVGFDLNLKAGNFVRNFAGGKVKCWINWGLNPITFLHTVQLEMNSREHLLFDKQVNIVHASLVRNLLQKPFAKLATSVTTFYPQKFLDFGGQLCSRIGPITW